MYFYKAYGLGIRSEIQLPELLVGSRAFDVDIKREKIASNFKRQMKDDCFWANDSELFRLYPNISSFLIRQGREIIVDPNAGVNENIIRPYLLGNIFGSLLHQRGLLVLHGSAVMMNGKAVVILGPSGSGKSTAAASLISKGYSLVADDVIAINGDINGFLFVYPSFPQLKLFSDVAVSLGYDPKILPYDHPEESKLVVRFTSEFSSDPIPLARIYILKKGDPTNIIRLGQMESMIKLVQNSYAVKSLNARANLSSHFSQCTKVAKYVPICRFIRPFDIDSLPDFANALENDVRKG